MRLETQFNVYTYSVKLQELCKIINGSATSLNENIFYNIKWRQDLSSWYKY
jgi:hypothetical protein